MNHFRAGSFCRGQNFFTGMAPVHSDVRQLQALFSHVCGLRLPFIQAGEQRQAGSTRAADPEIEGVVGGEQQKSVFRIDEFGQFPDELVELD